MRKFALIVLLVIGFAGTAVLGSFAMDHGVIHGHDGCLAAAARRTDCPEEENSLSFANFHLDAFRSFSTAVFGENLAGVLLSFAVLALAAALAVFAEAVAETPAFAGHLYQKQFLDSRSSPSQRKIVHWLALHEQSPARAAIGFRLSTVS